LGNESYPAGADEPGTYVRATGTYVRAS